MSAFSIGLSGLSAASKDLDVTSNNIANSETVGFKMSRAQFSDVYSNTLYGNPRTQTGSGVNVQAVTQQFNQGILTSSGNALDMAISGQGFFVLAPNATSNDLAYTRAGAFQVNKEGYVTNSAGQYLQGFPVHSDGSVSASALASTIPIQLPNTSGAPKATTAVGLSVNLDASDTQPVDSSGTPIAFDATNQNSYNYSTSVTVYDSVGTSHTVSYYFVKDAPPTPPASQTWSVYAAIDGYTDQGTPAQPTDGSAVATTVGTLAFDASGRLTGASVPTIAWTGVPGLADLNVGTYFGSNNAPIETGLPGATQFSQGFSVTGLNQDGYAPGQLTGIEISQSGVVQANYSNGQSAAIAKVALANFTNPQGLRQIGDTNWKQSLASGEPLAGEAGTGVFGLIKSGSLEQSNVDLTSELVHLIVAQRGFQANAKSIETASRLNETIINLR